MIALDYQIKG